MTSNQSNIHLLQFYIDLPYHLPFLQGKHIQHIHSLLITQVLNVSNIQQYLFCTLTHILPTAYPPELHISGDLFFCMLFKISSFVKLTCPRISLFSSLNSLASTILSMGNTSTKYRHCDELHTMPSIMDVPFLSRLTIN